MRRSDNNRKLKIGSPALLLASQIMSHVSIVLACVMAVIFVCDVLTGGGMYFLANTLTKTMLLIFCAIVIVNTPLQLANLRRLKGIKKYDSLVRNKK